MDRKPVFTPWQVVVSEVLRDGEAAQAIGAWHLRNRLHLCHDEILDWHDNIRVDYGYAMTIASAQGLTVDRAFLLADERPARETIYPAATRHREGIDVYVNRSPLAFDIAERWPEDQPDMPVTDSDVRAYLAERWSRSEPKEATLDYISEGAWRNAREGAKAEFRNGTTWQKGTTHDGPGDGQGETARALAAANDNAIVRITRELRHAALGWRHGAAVEHVNAGRGADCPGKCPAQRGVL